MASSAAASSGWAMRRVILSFIFHLPLTVDLQPRQIPAEVRREQADNNNEHGRRDERRDLAEVPVDQNKCASARDGGQCIDMLDEYVRRNARHHVAHETAANARERAEKTRRNVLSRCPARIPVRTPTTVNIPSPSASMMSMSVSYATRNLP